MFVPCFVFQYFVFIQFCNHPDGKERAGCFIFTVFLMSCDSQCIVAFPLGAVGWSVVCVIVVFSDHSHLLFCNPSKCVNKYISLQLYSILNELKQSAAF